MDPDQPDNPSSLVQRPDVPEEAGSHRRFRWKLALPLIAVLVLAAAGLVGLGLVHGGLGSDGIPTQIDGQRVYRVTEQAEWHNLGGSFLLGGYPYFVEMICVPTTAASDALSTPAERDLLTGNCSGMALASSTGPTTAMPWVAPKSPGLDSLDSFIFSWGRAVVLRVHTHDPEATQCPADERSRCEAAVVVDGVVWPTVPAEINGEHVYRAPDSATFDKLSSSFLLGGIVAYARTDSSCATPFGWTEAEKQLLGACQPRKAMIDGNPIAPLGNFDSADGQMVVVRAHVNDALAAQCPTSDRVSCESAVVVESVVWSANPYST
jgi:hypothetical protein